MKRLNILSICFFGARGVGWRRGEPRSSTPAHLGPLLHTCTSTHTHLHKLPSLHFSLSLFSCAPFSSLSPHLSLLLFLVSSLISLGLFQSALSLSFSFSYFPLSLPFSLLLTFTLSLTVPPFIAFPLPLPSMHMHVDTPFHTHILYLLYRIFTVLFIYSDMFRHINMYHCYNCLQYSVQNLMYRLVA